MFILLISILLVSISYYFYKRHGKNTQFNNLSKKLPGPVSFPLVGNVPGIFLHRNDILSYLIEHQKKYGKVTRHWMGPNLYTYLSDPNDLKILFLKGDESGNSPLYDVLRPILRNAILLSSGKLWHANRAIVSKCFEEGLLENYLVTINQKANILKQHINLKDEKMFDIFPDIELYVTTVLLELAAGIEVDSENQIQKLAIKQLHKLSKKLGNKNFVPVLPMEFIVKQLMKFKKIEMVANVADLLKFVFIERGRWRILKFQDEVFSRSFLNVLLNHESKTFGEDEIADEFSGLIFAGYETTIAATSYAIYYLANNKEVQTKAYKEILKLFETMDTNETNLKKIQECSYLDQVINEVLRIKPPIPYYSRHLSEDLVLTNHTIPAKSTVNIFTYMIHHSEDLYPNPEVFDPERFSPENVAKRPPYAFIPFGAGSRCCLGQKLGVLIIKMALIKILSNFELSPGEPIEKHSVFFVMHSVNGIKIRLQARR